MQYAFCSNSFSIQYGWNFFKSFIVQLTSLRVFNRNIHSSNHLSYCNYQTIYKKIKKKKKKKTTHTWIKLPLPELVISINKKSFFFPSTNNPNPYIYLFWTSNFLFSGVYKPPLKSLYLTTFVESAAISHCDGLLATVLTGATIKNITIDHFWSITTLVLFFTVFLKRQRKPAFCSVWPST